LESGAEMGIFNNLFGEKAAPVRNDSDAPRSPVGAWGARSRIPVVAYQESISAESAMIHPILFRIIHKIATSVQTIDWYCEADPTVPERERATASSIKKINDLLKSPNDSLTSDQLRYWCALNIAVFGKVPFKVGVTPEGLANGIYPLDARYVRAQLDARDIVQSYSYGAESKEILPSRRVAQRRSEKTAFCYEISTPSLSGSMRSLQNTTALGAVGLPAQVIKLLLQRAVDTASGHPNTKYIIAAEKVLTNAQKTSLTEQIESSAAGEEESGNILFLYGTAIDVHKLDNDLSDIHSKMPMDDMARLMAGAYGVPIALLGLGASDGAKFAGNYIESRLSFYADTIIPMYCCPIEVGLTEALCPYGARIRFDRDSVEALKNDRVTRAAQLTKVDFLDADEKRELIGFPPRTPEQIAAAAAEAATKNPAKIATESEDTV
jgi:phage portal protein BeeE